MKATLAIHTPIRPEDSSVKETMVGERNSALRLMIPGSLCLDGLVLMVIAVFDVVVLRFTVNGSNAPAKNLLVTPKLEGKP